MIKKEIINKAITATMTVPKPSCLLTIKYEIKLIAIASAVKYIADNNA